MVMLSIKPSNPCLGIYNFDMFNKAMNWVLIPKLGQNHLSKKNNGHSVAIYSILFHYIPVVPHKAVAEVSKIGNL